MVFSGSTFKRFFTHCFLICLLLSSHTLNAADLSAQAVAPNQLLIKFKPGISAAAKASIFQQLGAIKSNKLLRIPTTRLTTNSVASQALATLRAWEKVTFSPGSDLFQLISLLSQNPAVEVVQPDYILRTSRIPDDPDLDRIWAMLNINAPLAWDLTTGSKNILVAVIDSGVLHTHPDLKNNMWINPGEIADNGLDDDNNDYVDDVFGYDFLNSDSNPTDDLGHGTHVAGTIGAVGNNNVGVVGVNWNVSIMALKFIGPNGGFTSGAILAIEYAIANGAKIINASWGGAGFSTAMSNAITAANAAGVLFVAAAGNGDPNLPPGSGPGVDNDRIAIYPANFPHTNIISVASIDNISSTNNYNIISSFSNFGLTTVDLGAPGRGILSTWNNGAYITTRGTSMAAPHVTGAAALLWSAAPNLTHLEIKDLLLQNTKPNIDLASTTTSGGQLNVWNALQQLDTIPPEAINSLTSSAVDTNSISLSWTAVGDDGMSGQVSSYDLRFSTLALNADNFSTATPVPGVLPTMPSNSLETFTVTNLIDNTNYNFAIVAVDDVGNRSPLSNIVSATTDRINLLPIANHGGPYQGNPNTAVRFDGAASSDPEGNTLTYSWDFGDGTTGSGATPSHTFTTAGVYTVSLTVNDLLLDSISVTTTASIANRDPISDPGGPYTGVLGQPIIFDGSGSSDPDGAVLSYSWDFGDGSTATGSNPSHSYLTAGSFNVQLTVDDGFAPSTTVSTIAVITEPINTPPSISQTTSTPSTILDTATSSLSVTVTDQENDTLTYLWSVTNNGGTFDNPVSATPVFTPADIVGSQTYTIEVLLFDGVNSVSDSVQITINDANPPSNNLPPTITQITADPLTILDTETSSLSVTASDPENATLSYSWTVENSNSGSFDDATSATPLFTPTDIVGSQIITISALVSDGLNSDSKSVQITVNDANLPVIYTPPAITQVVATPSTLNDEGQSTSSTLRVDVTDFENSQLVYRWTVKPDIDPSLVFDDPNSASPVFTPGDINGNKTVTVMVEISDGVNTVSGSTEIIINDAIQVPATRLLTENFQLTDLNNWTIVDVFPVIGNRVVKQAPSEWSTYSGTLWQSSNIYSTSAGVVDLEKLGTYCLYNRGMNWSDYRLKTKIKSQDNDSLGILFRVQDNNNYYRFSWDNSRQYRRLVKNLDNNFTILAEDKIPYIMNQEYMLEIIAKGDFIQILIDDQVVFTLSDSDIIQGSIGLYSWSNAGSTFDNITVDDITNVNLPP